MRVYKGNLVIKYERADFTFLSADIFHSKTSCFYFLRNSIYCTSKKAEEKKGTKDQKNYRNRRKYYNRTNPTKNKVYKGKKNPPEILTKVFWNRRFCLKKPPFISRTIQKKSSVRPKPKRYSIMITIFIYQHGILLSSSCSNGGLCLIAKGVLEMLVRSWTF